MVDLKINHFVHLVTDKTKLQLSAYHPKVYMLHMYVCSYLVKIREIGFDHGIYINLLSYAIV